MRWCCFGYRILTTSLVILVLQDVIFSRATQPAHQFLHLLSGAGLIAVLLGLVRWGTVRGTQRTLTLLALAVGVFSATLFTPYLWALNSGNYYVSGLFHLFGATAFAMLLTSQELTALAVRGWAMRTRDRRSVHLSYLAVIGFAFCGVCHTAMVFQTSGWSEPTMSLLRWSSGIAATAVLLTCLEITRQQWRLVTE